MALRVWLPLNGTLENKGISDATASGGIIDNNGKIGKCYLVNNTNQLKVIHSIPKTSEWSMAFWMKMPASMANNTNWEVMFHVPTVNADSGADSFSNINWANYHNVKIWDDANHQWFWASPNTNFQYDKWHHWTITHTANGAGVQGKIYIDGTLINTYNQTTHQMKIRPGTITIGQDITTGGFYINDFRIYDHCLSPKEVKEISQGLVLHYKLDGWSGGINENLALDTANKINTSTAATKTVTLDYGLQSNFSLIRGKKITISADIILENAVSTATSGSKRVGFEPAIKYSDNTLQYMGYWIGLDSTPKTSSGRYSTTVTVQNKDFQSIAQNGTYIQGLTSGTATIKNIKVELGDEATPWSPAPQDLCIVTTKVIDSSGYENDGTITGTLSAESDSNRYEISTHYSGSSYTDTGSGTFNWFDFSQCTLSAWIKPTASVSGWSGSIGIQHDQNAGHKGFTITDYANNFRVVTVNGSYTTIDSGKPLTVGEWHHCAAVLNGTNLKMYYDGTMVKESTISWGSAAIATDMRFATGVDFPGTDEKFTGNYSDVRMYCTALSAEDISDLYHTSANIDNLHNIHSFEYNEIFTFNLYDFSAPWAYENLTGSTVNTYMGQAIKLVTSSTNQRAYKNVSNIWTTSGKQFVVSFIAKSDTEGITCDMSRSLADFTDKFTLSTKWKRYTGTITVTSTSTSGTLSFRINQSGATVYILDVKLEEANKNLISATKQGEFLENNIDEIEYSTVSKFKKESSNIIAKDFIEK